MPRELWSFAGEEWNLFLHYHVNHIFEYSSITVFFHLSFFPFRSVGVSRFWYYQLIFFLMQANESRVWRELHAESLSLFMSWWKVRILEQQLILRAADRATPAEGLLEETETATHVLRDRPLPELVCVSNCPIMGWEMAEPRKTGDWRMNNCYSRQK